MIRRSFYVDSVRDFDIGKLSGIARGPIPFRSGHVTMARDYDERPSGGYETNRLVETRFHLRHGTYVPISNEWPEPKFNDGRNYREDDVPFFLSGMVAHPFFSTVAPRYRHHRIKAGIHGPGELLPALDAFYRLGQDEGYHVDNIFFTTNGVTPTSLTAMVVGDGAMEVSFQVSTNTQLTSAQLAFIDRYHAPPPAVHTPPWGLPVVGVSRST